MSIAHLRVNAHKQGADKYVCYEDNLSKVVPLHVPEVVWTDYKPRDRLNLLKILILTLLNLTHSLNLFTTNLSHHSDNFNLLLDEPP